MSDFDSTLRWRPAPLDGESPGKPEDSAADRQPSADEAYLVVIAHPEARYLGTRYGLHKGRSFIVGRSSKADISFPGITSISRFHAKVEFDERDEVWISDLDSTNGTLVDDVVVQERRQVASGERIQLGAVHFKLLHERDVEHAYHVAVYEMMMRDGLTQLFNRRKFEEEAQREIARSSRYSRPLSLMLFDVDEFKAVNDTHGHAAGDAVLQRIAARTREITRTEQVVARLGGDEFAILCPELDTHGVELFAERLRKEIGGIQHEARGQLFHVRCSFGAAGWSAEIGTLDAFLELADRALYASKQMGRDSVTVGAT